MGKRQYGIRLSTEAVERLDALKGDYSATGYLERLVNMVLFDKIDAYFRDLSGADKADKRQESMLKDITVKLDLLLSRTGNTPIPSAGHDDARIDRLETMTETIATQIVDMDSSGVYGQHGLSAQAKKYLIEQTAASHSPATTMPPRIRQMLDNGTISGDTVHKSHILDLVQECITAGWEKQENHYKKLLDYLRQLYRDGKIHCNGNSAVEKFLIGTKEYY